MSFNIRLDTPVDGKNQWKHRKEVLVAEVKANDPLFLGVQEAKWNQMEDLSSGLPEYGWIGRGRDDGDKGGEFSAVFYKKDKVKLLDSGTFWLSETPEKAGSLGWDAACRRVVSWGKFQCNKTQKQFFYANTHFDHRGNKARIESAKLIRKKIDSLAGNLPLFVSGDFNTTSNSNVYKIITSECNGVKGWIDSHSAAKVQENKLNRTFHDFGKVTGNKGSIIDFIFASGPVTIEKFKICPELRDGKLTSDHNAIVATISIQ